MRAIQKEQSHEMAYEKPAAQMKGQKARKAYIICKQGISAAAHSPAAWLFAALWLLSAVYPVLAGYAGLVAVAFLVLVVVLLLSLLTLPLTAGTPTLARAQDRPASRGILWVQIAILLTFIVFTGLRGMAFHGNLPSFLLFLAPMMDALNKVSFMLVNPILYFVLPMALLLILGVRWREVGLGRGYHSWRVTLLWSFLMLVLLLAALVLQRVGILPLLLALLSNSLQNGFFEGFLFRGALMSRLGRLFRQRWDWAIVLSALTFGLWHIGLEAQGFNGNYLLGAAHTILMQAVYGVGFAIVVYRTRNLLASSIIHVLLNVTL